MKGQNWFSRTVVSKQAQILLPAVMLAPIFILVVYLLFETSKLSMTKVRQQFALDNGAYSQMSTTSAYLNSVAMVNGPLPYRVMKTFDQPLAKQPNIKKNQGDLTVFDIFYKAGAFQAAGKKHNIGKEGAISNQVPKPEATDWQFSYFPGKRTNWNKEDPTDSFDKDGKYILTDKEIAENYFFGAKTLGIASIKEYTSIFARVGSIYNNQKYVYDTAINKSNLFRASYFANTKDCPRMTCGKQAAEVLDKYVMETKVFDIDKVRFYVTADFSKYRLATGSFPLDLAYSETIKTKLFQFAYLTPGSRSRLRQLGRGIVLKQKFTVPANRFNINLTERYKPYVRNTVTVTCPRGNNNCVWPNPIPKYSVKVGV